ncbi:ATP-NAD kinase-like domain-containing protein [Gamsiella multidivaricata]|uniref:ATP-NAD kinase-like domain-containing protein n=1 Tax=Gamsiella multidivaricata TaxID=101098 RepID=UPI00221F7F4D|nr:ATP-NAD kinase-like domain-containing protein [Gamsiella multidivaricata]KAG0363455.1 NADH kinase pos5 [Gamsiella multidivaricata]KAI7818292.1 ATP-NAD kinase-like domain-containing protein [Gamsiella multidivaricata]
MRRANLHAFQESFQAFVSKQIRAPHVTQLHACVPRSHLSGITSSTAAVFGTRFYTTPRCGMQSPCRRFGIIGSTIKHIDMHVSTTKRGRKSFSSYVPYHQDQKDRTESGKDITIDRPARSEGGSTGAGKLTSELPTRIKMILDTPGVFPKDLAPNTDKEPSREIVQSFGTTYGGNYMLQWEDAPRTILIIKKPNDELTDKALVDVATWIHSTYPHMNVVVEPEVAHEFAGRLPFLYTIPDNKRVEYTRVTDLVVTLGGDGTILHTSSLFNSAVPPVISFSMGTLGFLLPYHINNYQAALTKLIDNRQASLLLRMRLKCTLHGADGRRLQAKDGSGRINDLTVMNEVNLHRGRYPHLTWIGCYVDGHLITEAVADGLIVASPTGSTAYSLSAGGSIVHPSIQSLLLTPICPRSLSFRPVLLPPNATIQLKIGEKSRGPAEVSLDGKETFFLDKNEFLQVCMSAFPMPCVNRVHAGEDWIKDINDLLKWNQGFLNKQSMSHYMSE